jgi:hypothetical protein
LSKLNFFAQIADDGQKQNCTATHVTFGSEIRMVTPLPVPELWRENTSGLSKSDFFATEGAQITDDGQKQNSRTTHVTFGSDNWMSIPPPVPELWRENTSGLSKLDFFVTEGAQIADDGQKQPDRATHVTFGSENRMSIQLPVPELWLENTSGLSKLDFLVTEGAQLADDGQKQTSRATHVTF